MIKNVKIRKSTIFIMACLTLLIIINIISWKSIGFSDWHRKYIFPVLQGVFSRISGIFPFSVGEILIFLAIITIVFGPISYIILIIIKKDKRKKISYIYGKTLLCILLCLFTLETSNFFILYHCSSFAQNYGLNENKHTSDELYITAVHIYKQTEEASKYIHRDENGAFILSCDLYYESKSAMQNLGNDYQALSGYYPNPKPLIFSDIATQLSLLGIYFPFSFEANYNNNIYEVELPATVCHELSHLKGWMQEDEANFISFLACTKSENPDFVYSGYLSALEYIWAKISEDSGVSDEDFKTFFNSIDPSIMNDFKESYKVFQKAQESKVGEVMSNVSETAIEVSLKVNGVEDGAKSYDRFTDLLLNYYLDDDGNIIEQ